jgi:hypothetical protein
MEKVEYRDDMPKGAYLKLGSVVLVGTGLKYKEGDEKDERVLPKTRG